MKNPDVPHTDVRTQQDAQRTNTETDTETRLSETKKKSNLSQTNCRRDRERKDSE